MITKVYTETSFICYHPQLTAAIKNNDQVLLTKVLDSNLTHTFAHVLIGREKVALSVRSFEVTKVEIELDEEGHPSNELTTIVAKTNVSDCEVTFLVVTAEF